MNTLSGLLPVIVDGVLKRAGADAEAEPGTQAWALAQIGLMYSALVEALHDCVAAEQPMSQMHATEQARQVLGDVGRVLRASVFDRAGADDQAEPGTPEWDLAQVKWIGDQLVKVLRNCVDAEQPMAQMRATERARQVLGVAEKNSARCAIRSAGLATGLRTDLDVTLSVIAELRARNALRSLDSALRESSSEGVTVYIGPNKTEQRLRAQLDELISCRQRRTADPSGDASAG